MPILVWISWESPGDTWPARIVVGRGVGTTRDLLVGTAGAIVGGLIFHVAGPAATSRFNIATLYVSTAGALVALVAYHAAMRDHMRR